MRKVISGILISVMFVLSFSNIWFVNEKTDQLTGEVTYILIGNAVYYSDTVADNAKLFVGFSKNNSYFVLGIDWGTYVPSHISSDELKVAYKFDSGYLYTEMWQIDSTSWQTFKPNAVNFLVNMLNSKKLTIRVYASNNTTKTAIFDLTGLKYVPEFVIIAQRNGIKIDFTKNIGKYPDLTGFWAPEFEGELPFFYNIFEQNGDTAYGSLSMMTATDEFNIFRIYYDEVFKITQNTPAYSKIEIFSSQNPEEEVNATLYPNGRLILESGKVFIKNKTK